jgi:hypothetical protein
MKQLTCEIMEDQSDMVAPGNCAVDRSFEFTIAFKAIAQNPLLNLLDLELWSEE